MNMCMCFTMPLLSNYQNKLAVCPSHSDELTYEIVTSDLAAGQRPYRRQVWVSVTSRSSQEAGQIKEIVVQGFFSSLHPCHNSSKERSCREYSSHGRLLSLRFKLTLTPYDSHPPLHLYYHIEKTRSTVLNSNAIAFRKVRLLWTTLHTYGKRQSTGDESSDI